MVAITYLLKILTTSYESISSALSGVFGSHEKIEDKPVAFPLV